MTKIRRSLSFSGLGFVNFNRLFELFDRSCDNRLSEQALSLVEVSQPLNWKRRVRTSTTLVRAF
jgi:hypothetical protein